MRKIRRNILRMNVGNRGMAQAWKQIQANKYGRIKNEALRLNNKPTRSIYKTIKNNVKRILNQRLSL